MPRKMSSSSEDEKEGLIVFSEQDITDLIEVASTQRDERVKRAFSKGNLKHMDFFPRTRQDREYLRVILENKKLRNIHEESSHIKAEGLVTRSSRWEL